MHELRGGHLSRKHSVLKLRQLRHGHLLICYWSYYCYYVLVMCRWQFRRVDWIECVHGMHGGIVLRHDGSYSCNGTMYQWQVCCCRFE